MSLTKLTENLNKVSALPDKPTLSSAQLKAVFDEAVNIIKTYLNETLTIETEELITTKVNQAKVTVDNVLTSESTTHALSALQGKTLNDALTTTNANVSALDTGKQKKITTGTSAPSGGSDGDIYIQYF